MSDHGPAPPAPPAAPEPYTVYIERIAQPTDPRLKRYVEHDSRSRRFAFDTRGIDQIVSVTHTRHIGILNQGNVGSCTGHAGIGDLACTPLFEKLPAKPKYTLDRAGAEQLYSAAQVIDGNGRWPPNDNGSTGLSIAKALKAAGLISQYQHTFSLDAALKAASRYPFITGMNWYSSMFTPEPDGRIRPTGTLAGGHEVLCRQIDAENRRVWLDNSWGSNWGVNGRCYLTFDDFGTLLSQQGDVTILIPAVPPPPPPPPPPPKPKPAPKPKPKPRPKPKPKPMRKPKYSPPIFQKRR